MSAADRYGADRYGADRYGADRYGPGRFPGTHVHDAHEGGGAVQTGGAPVSDSLGDSEAVRAGAPLGESVPAGMRAVLAARAAGRAEEDTAIAAAVADVRAAAASTTDLDAHAHDALGRVGRHDGWTGERQRDFLAAIAEGHTVEQACRTVGLSVASAYALRRRAGGAAFALGWRAATLLAREHVADTLLARAIEGQTETVTRANGDVIERHRYDNRLAMSLLARLDRQAEAPAAADAPGGHLAAQMVAGEFDAFLDLVGRDGGPARAGLFLALRTEVGVGSEAETPGTLADLHTLARADRFVRTGAGTAAEVDVTDLDPAQRGRWTAEQWARAEAAGLVTLAPPPPPEPALETEAGADCAVSPQLPQLDLDVVTIGADAEEAPVWWDEPTRAYRTTLAPPPGFDGDEEGAFGDDDYTRSLDEDEAAIAARLHAAERAGWLAMERAGRDDWFATADNLAALPAWAPDEQRLAA